MASKLVVGLFAIFVSGVVSYAAPVTLQFFGTLTQVPIDDLYGDIAAGSPFSGSFTFETAAADLVPADLATGSYTSSGAPFGMTVNLGGRVFSAQDSLNIGIINSFVDQYTVLALRTDGSLTLELFLQDNSGTGFSSDALPSSLPSSPFTVRDFHLHEVTAAGEFQADGHLDTVPSATPIPEPASGSLLLTGAGLLMATNRGIRRKI